MSKAAKQNPALQPFDVLVGTWTTDGHHPAFPGTTLHGRTSFEWVENGAFLLMRSHIDHKDFPDGIAIFGSDDATGEFTMNYFDERGISRKYTCTMENDTWKWWRNDATFSQRFTVEISGDGSTMMSTGEMSREGKHWEKDLELTYTRT